MQTIRYIWTIALLINSWRDIDFSPANVKAPPPLRWSVEKNSVLSISGKSNINSFICDINEYLHPDTIAFLTDDATDKALFLTGGLSVEIDKFDCHHRFITSDFRKTLKAETNPKLNVRFLTIDRFAFNNSNTNVKGWVTIEIAGVARKFEINYSVQSNGDHRLLLSGTRELRFSDFSLTPPTRLAGLIRIEQEINVQFHLYLKEV